MTDLIERLRNWKDLCEYPEELVYEAADELEALRQLEAAVLSGCPDELASAFDKLRTLRGK